MCNFTDKELLEFVKAKLKFTKIDGEMCLDEVNADVNVVRGRVNVVRGYSYATGEWAFYKRLVES